jgi:hypothetical protein
LPFPHSLAPFFQYFSFVFVPGFFLSFNVGKRFLFSRGVHSTSTSRHAKKKQAIHQLPFCFFTVKQKAKQIVKKTQK